MQLDIQLYHVECILFVVSYAEYIVPLIFIQCNPWVVIAHWIITDPETPCMQL